MLGTGAAIAKIAVTPSCLSDNLVILDLLLEADMPLCMIAMGERGRHLAGDCSYIRLRSDLWLRERSNGSRTDERL